MTPQQILRSRIDWPLHTLFETTQKWKLEAQAGVYLLQPLEGSFPVVAWLRHPPSMPSGRLQQAFAKAILYSHQVEPTEMDIPLEAICIDVDGAFVDERFLSISMPALPVDRAARWIHVRRMLESVAPEHLRISSTRGITIPSSPLGATEAAPEPKPAEPKTSARATKSSQLKWDFLRALPPAPHHPTHPTHGAKMLGLNDLDGMIESTSTCSKCQQSLVQSWPASLLPLRDAWEKYRSHVPGRGQSWFGNAENRLEALRMGDRRAFQDIGSLAIVLACNIGKLVHAPDVLNFLLMVIHYEENRILSPLVDPITTANIQLVKKTQMEAFLLLHETHKRSI